MHRTYRWLDAPPRLLGFSFRQWLILVLCIAGGYGLAKALHLPFKIAISLGVFAIGLPAALAYLSDGDGLPVGRMVLDGLSWTWARLLLWARQLFREQDDSRSLEDASACLGLLAIGEDGLALRADGTYLRYLEVEPVNPLVSEESVCAQISEAFGGVLGRLEGSQALQLYVQARPLAVEELLSREAHSTALACASASSEGDPALAEALRLLGGAVEDSLRTHCSAVAAMSLRYLVVVPHRPPHSSRKARGNDQKKIHPHERAMRDCARHTEGIRRDLEAMRLAVRPLDGPEVLDLLCTRFNPDCERESAPAASFMRPDAIGLPLPGEDAEVTLARTRALAQAICALPLDFSPRSHVRVGDTVEQVSYLSGVPERTWLGWMLHLMQAPLPFSLSVHVTATDRLRERQAQRRRWKRLRGVNLGTEARGRPVDPTVSEQEREAEELSRDLAVTAGAAIYHVGVYLRLSEPDGDLDALAEHSLSASRETMLVSDARLDRGAFAQRALWQSSLPLARDTVHRTRRYLTRNVADTWPLVSTSCGSPNGLALGYAQPGRTLERLDPFDPEHPNHMLVVVGRSGAGKTMTVNLLLIRGLARGLSAAIIDRAGHYQSLVSLIPGAVQVKLGGRGNREAVCPWDVPDPSRVDQSKVDYLLALHSLLLGRRDGTGLGDLEENLLGLCIREVYARCALTGEQPRELILQEELYRREASELRACASDVAATLRNLGLRLNNYVGDGPYAYLTDWPTTVGESSRLLSFDTRAIPDSRAGAALFIIVEHVTSRIERDRETRLASGVSARGWEGRHALVIDEAWKLVAHEATGRWFNELSRRSRHLALWLIAMSHSLADFDNEYGQALLRNAAMRLFLQQDTTELS